MLALTVALVSALGSTETDAGTDAGAEDDRDSRHQTVVTATRAPRMQDDVVVGTEVINRQQIEQTGARDLPQLLQQQPGVEIVYTNRSVGVRLQGLDPEYTLLLIDGQRVSGRAGPSTDISRFSLRDIERVEIVKGPAAALYGADAIGGVINLVTRRPQKELEGVIRGTFGTLLEGDVRANAGAKLGNFELRAGGGYRTRNAFDWDTSDVATSLPSLMRYDGDLEVGWQPSEAVRLVGKASYVRSDMFGVDVNDTRAVFDRRQRTEQVDGSLGGTFVPWKDSHLNVRGHFGFFRDQFQLDQRASRALDDYNQGLTRLWEANAMLDQKLDKHLLMVGFEAIFEGLSSDRLNPAQVNRYRLAGFAQDEWTSRARGEGPRITVAPGFRFDGDSQFGAAPSPRLAVKIDPFDAITVRASWGLGFRPPTFSELYLQFANAAIGYVVQGNPKLTAERSASVNLGVDYRLPLDGWTLSVNAWHTSLTNLINVTADSPPNPDNPTTYAYENVANAYTQGVELSARMKISKGAWVDLSYTGQNPWDVTRNRPLEGRAAHRVNLQLTGKYKPTGLEATVRATFSSARPFYLGQGGGAVTNVLGFGDAQVVYAPAYFDLEAQVTYTFRSWLKVFVNGYNLLNSGDQQFNPRPPRGVLGGVQLEY